MMPWVKSNVCCGRWRCLQSVGFESYDSDFPASARSAIISSSVYYLLNRMAGTLALPSVQSGIYNGDFLRVFRFEPKQLVAQIREGRRTGFSKTFAKFHGRLKVGNLI